MTDPDLSPMDEGQRDVLAAALDLVGRTGATGLEIGYLDGDEGDGPDRWWAHAQYRGSRITVEHQPGPHMAADALARRLLQGGQCAGCRSIVAFAGDDRVWVPDAAAAETARQRGACGWQREGDRWVRGCGEDPPADSTRHRLATALVDAGAPVGMVAAARAGRYDDYLSDLPTPIHALVADLSRARLTDLADRARSGEFDGTRDEARAWAASPEGREVLAAVARTAPDGNRAQRRAAQRRRP